MEQFNYSPLWISLKTAFISTVIVFLIGIVLSFLMARKSFPGKSFVEALFLLPLILPPTVIGFGLLYIFGKHSPVGKLLEELFNIQIIFTWYGALLASIVVSFPLMYQSAKAAFQQYDSRLEQAALTLGKTPFYVFWTISFPLAWPGLLAGTVLAFARGFGEFGATLMIAGFIPGVTETIPLAIYFAVESGNISVAQFWVIAMIVLGYIAVLWLNWWSTNKMMRHHRSN